MQIEMQLSFSSNGELAFDYYHELSSALYQTLDKFYPQQAKELHEGSHRSRIKLFVFSPFSSIPKPEVITLPNGSPGLKFGSRVWMRFASIWPELIFHMAEAIQKAHKIVVRGQCLRIEKLEMVPIPNFAPTMTYRPFGQAGFIVCRYNKNQKTFFQMPDNSENGIPSCQELIIANLRHKLLRLREIRPDVFDNIVSIGGLDAEAIADIPIRVEFLKLKKDCPYRTRLTQIKTTNIRAFRAPVRITAPEAIHRLVWDSGLGSLNSQGFGLMTLGDN